MPEAQLELRRRPAQRRSLDRIALILDAADRLLAMQGAPGLGTTQVARAAGVSIGSLYHWFPDKESIVHELALRHWEDLTALVDTVAESAEQGMSDDPLEDVLTALSDGFRARPGFLAMWFSPLRTEDLRAVTRPLRASVAAAVLRILTVMYPNASAGDRQSAAQMVTLLGDGLLREAFRAHSSGDAQILTEGAIALRAYVDTRLGNGASHD